MSKCYNKRINVKKLLVSGNLIQRGCIGKLATVLVHQCCSNAVSILITFSGLGSIARSRSIFNGTAGVLSDPSTSTAWSSDRKQCLDILAANASAKELFCCSSVSTRHLPCLTTVSNTRCSSSGNKVRKSTMVTCPLCEKSLYNKYSLQKHIAAEHAPRINEGPDT